MRTPAMPTSRRHLLRNAAGGAGLALLMGGPAFLLGGCGSLLGPREVLITQTQLQDRLARRFPLDRQLMQLLDVQLQAPVLSMLPERNRVQAQVPVVLKNRLAGGPPVRGSVAVSFGLRFEPADLSLRLTDLALERLEAPGLPPALERMLGGLGSWVADEALRDVTVHQWQPQDLQTLDRAGLRVGGIRVASGGLVVALVARD